MLSVTADSIAQRLCQLAEQRLGPPPVPYAFVVVGSHGRKELGFVSDQDNALVISDDEGVRCFVCEALIQKEFH
nr:DUF294 nucleotidyltransferase-like domain-containing protein [Corynebacterium diphtheriae]